VIEEAVVARLRGFSGLIALLGSGNNGIYAHLQPQDPVYPTIVYTRISAQRVTAMGADPGVVHSRFQFDAYGILAKDARDVSEQVRQALERWRGTSGATVIQDSFIDNVQDSPVELVSNVAIYRTITEVMIHHTDS
jgi:hypothetical protein